MEIRGRNTVPPVDDVWRCEYKDKAGKQCEVSGTVRQRTGVPFHRHVCYGHGEDHDRQRIPVSIIICQRHHIDWSRTHGVDFPEPELH